MTHQRREMNQGMRIAYGDFESMFRGSRADFGESGGVTQAVEKSRSWMGNNSYSCRERVVSASEKPPALTEMRYNSRETEPRKLTNKGINKPKMAIGS